MKMVSNSLKGSLNQITKLSCKTGKTDLSTLAAGNWQGLNFDVLTVGMLHLKMDVVFSSKI
jgi:hypothetical protein